LESTLGVPVIDSWLRSATLLELSAECARLAVPSKLHAARIRKEFAPHLLRTMEVDDLSVEVESGNDTQLSASELPLLSPPAAESSAAQPAPEKESVPAPRNSFMDESDSNRPILNPTNRFESFVVGPCNRFAHAACRGVADRPATAFNPLFLHGSVGLGKTHLMQGVCHHLLDHDASMRILFLSCEEFINHFIGALQQGDVNKFRDRYRQADVLIIDDIQMLANKARTQEEFFHTFNALHNARKQIVLSSDAPPEDIPALQERLVSRFKWGLVAEIETPCFETRVAILNSKADHMGLRLASEVPQFLAENIENNVRELEGSLVRLQAMASLTNRPIDMGLAREVLGPSLRNRSRPVRMDDILEFVTQHFNVKVSDLQGKRRTQTIVLPRQISMYLARQLTEMSLEEIGGYFGGRDHSTVLYSVDRVDTRRRVDADFAALLAELERAIKRATQHDS